MLTSTRYAGRPIIRSVLELVGATVVRYARAIHRHYEQRRAEAQLMSLDDRLLKDIGIGRSEILAAIHGAPAGPRGGHAANDTSGRRLACREAGSGHPVLLLHSTASTGGQWKSLTGRLAPLFRVVAPDLPGYGRSKDANDGAGGLLADAAPVIALIEEIGAPVHLVGHSYGGAVALKIATSRPELVRSLCVIEPVAFHLLHDAAAGDRALLGEVAAVEAAIRGAIEMRDPERGMARFIDFWNGEGSWARLEPEMRSHLCGQIDRVVANFAAIANESPSLAPSRAIGCPTLAIRAERSPAPVRRIAELLAGGIPGALLAEIPGAGHMAPITHPQRVDPLVANHIFTAESDAGLGLRRQNGTGLKPAA